MQPDIDRLKQHGFQLFRELLSPVAVGSIRAFLESEHIACEREIRKALAIAPTETMKDFVGRNLPTLDQVPADIRNTLFGHFPLQTRLSEKLWPVADAPALRDVLEFYFDSTQLRMHMPPAARYVPPDYPYAAVPAHQDAAYNRHMTDFLAVWVPLVAIDSDCGGVGIYEGTGNAPVLEPRPSPVPYWLGAVPTDGLTLLQHDMKPGDALIFNPFVIHASMPNRSARTRYSIDYRFFSGPSTKHYLDLQTRAVIPPTDAR